MKKTLSLLPLLFSILLTVPAKAQTGWKWGVGGTTDTTIGYEEVSSTIDRSGNVFEASVVYDGFGMNHFGPINVYDSVNEMVITKTDSSGNFLWVLTTPNTEVSYEQGVDMATDVSGNLYVAGYYTSPQFIMGADTLLNPASDFMYYLLKISPSGNVIWAKNVAKADSSYYFTTGNFAGTCNIGLDAAGNIYMNGDFLMPSMTIGSTTLVNANPGADDAFIAKFDPLGNPIWAKSFGGTGNEYGVTMDVTAAGNIYMSGGYTSPSLTLGATTLTGSASYICKFDSTGAAVWAKNINTHASVISMAADQAENVYVAGGIDTSIIYGPDTLAFAGRSLQVGFWQPGEGDAFLAKYSPAGNILWARSAGGDSTDMAWDIAVDTCGNVWVCGTMGFLAYLDRYSMGFSGHVITDSALSQDNMFIAAYDNSGNYLTAMPVSIGGDDAAQINLDNNGNFYIAGDYNYYYAVFGADTLSFNSGYEVPFVARYKYSNTHCEISFPHTEVRADIPGTLKMVLFPNPASTLLTIAASERITSINISDLLGRTVHDHEYDTTQVQVDIADLPNGVYLVRINGAEVRKFVKE
jgi:hypothetical protein